MCCFGSSGYVLGKMLIKKCIFWVRLDFTVNLILMIAEIMRGVRLGTNERNVKKLGKKKGSLHESFTSLSKNHKLASIRQSARFNKTNSRTTGKFL